MNIKKVTGGGDLIGEIASEYDCPLKPVRTNLYLASAQ